MVIISFGWTHTKCNKLTIFKHSKSIKYQPYIKLFAPILHTSTKNAQHDATELFDELIPKINNYGTPAFNYFITDTKTISYKTRASSYTLYDTKLFFPTPISLSIHSIQNIVHIIEHQANIRYPSTIHNCHNNNCTLSKISVRHKYTRE